MSIQTLRTAGASHSRGKGRQAAGLVGSLALAAVVATGVVIGMSNRQAGSTETTVVTSGQALPNSSMLPADTLAWEAEQTILQQQLTDAAQANGMGSVTERSTVRGAAIEPEHPLNATDMQLIGQLAVPAQGDVRGCDAEPMETLC